MSKTTVAQQVEISNVSPPTQGILQRKCVCGSQTVGGGECAECGQKKLGLQRKLTIGASNDPLEREADRVADQVMRMPANSSIGRAPPRIQRFTGQGQADTAAPASVDRVLASSGRLMESNLRQDMEQRFGHDFSQVRIHSGAAAEQSARDVSAHAYTAGNNVVFGAGLFSPRTDEGKRLIAHELTHVVQQVGPKKSHSAGKLIQRRRVPSNSGLNNAIPTDVQGLVSTQSGLARMLSRAWVGLSTLHQGRVRTAMTLFGFIWTTEANLLIQLNSASRSRLLVFAQAIRTVSPPAELGNPLLINSGARSGTNDAVNIATVVNNANTIFQQISGSSQDASLTEVFGAANITTARTRYANARVRMNQLKTTNRIVTDRSGYNAEVRLGGLSNSAQISVAPAVIDSPSNNSSVITMIHESMHAGNPRVVTDRGYIHQASFTALPALTKLRNAAHYEVVPRRILGAIRSFTGMTFIPAGTSVGGVTAPTLTTREQAIRGASEAFRFAWTAGLRLHSFFVRVFRSPSEWNTLNISSIRSAAPATARFANTLPFWSRVEMLTIHSRINAINPAGSPSSRPVTLIDLSLSEGLTRKLSQGMARVQLTSAAALRFERANASSAELATAAATVNAERDLLIRLIIRVNLRSITGTINRDERVIARMAKAGRIGSSDMFTVRPPSAFP